MIFNKNITALAKVNNFFLQVLATGANLELAVMSIPPAGETGEQVHEADQVVVFVEGEGYAAVSGERMPIAPDHLIFVPAGILHNLINTGSADLKLYTLYAPPEHKPGTAYTTQEESDAAQEAAM